MTPETLTDLERLQLYNQFALLERLEKDKPTKEYWQECQTILREGYTIEYGKIFTPFYSELRREESQYIMNVLEMYHALGASFDRLDDKGDLTKEAVAFPGFSGNEETSFLCYARYLKKEGRRWRDLLASHKEDLDGHFPSTFRYRAMLDKWQEAEDAHGIEGKYRLTKEQIKDILEEPRKRARQNK